MNKKDSIDLSIVILSYNTKDLLYDCLQSLERVKEKLAYEVIVVDNASSDGSVEMVQNHFPRVHIIVNEKNLGFAAGNNVAKNKVKGEYVLFLNSDTIVLPKSLEKTWQVINADETIGAITCRVNLKNGALDPDTLRSFPTPWVALTHFTHLDKMFKGSPLFDQYWYGYRNLNTTQDIDALQGAFCMARKEILDKVGWFDEDYFLDGEDIDLCFKIHEQGYRIVYYPEVSIIHIKGASKGKNKVTKQSFATRKRSVLAGVNSMEIFYKKRLWKRYPLPVSMAVLGGIQCIKLVRLAKLIIF